MSETGIKHTIQDIVNRCKCEVSLYVNTHRSYYITAEKYLDDIQEQQSKYSRLAESEVLQEMIKSDTVVCLHFYPRTPIGSYNVYHYDIQKAIDEAFEILESL